ncbi:protein ZINC INDUCED FACILITATOR-LIKE 1-like isoform X2 [Papaver somniferum]|uniref:protein ZINC INDUCED FACILITATOR-LIKE 1-like isoform X2 n=1 Tax=Papaver somniferum TaxID=3469 RepID=UPI000E6FE426|nr:protein ZINC INDUCED FACILITATOR-LIKE 1-like isoform X2 [Papaver somniferum]
MSSNTVLYYENCEGCKVDARKDEHKGVPYKELFFIWVVCLASSLPISCLFPFLYFMIKDFHIAKKEEDIGFYAGFVGSAYMFGRALTSILWGMIADRYGRKPVIIIGTLAVVVMNALFGLSTKFWMAISTRFILGLLCGLLGPIKAYACEVCRPEHQAVGLSLITTSWGVGLVIGPAMGGFLAKPAEKYSKLFPKGSLFARFPYFLPCLCISFCAGLAFIVCWWLPETLHTHSGTNEEQNVKDRNENLLETGTTGSDSKRSPFKNWPLMSSIIVYSVFSLHDMAYSEIFSLWAVSPKKFGGLSFSTKNVGLVLSITGCGLIISQQILYPMFERIFGHMKITRIASVLTIPLLTSYPFMAKFSGLSLSLVLNCASILKNAFYNAILTGLFIIQNNAVPQHQRGAANGIAMTSMSLFKAFGPAGGGAIFSWALKRMDASFLPGVHMVFFILNVIEVVGLLLTCKAFLPLPKSKGQEIECFQNERGSR